MSNTNGLDTINRKDRMPSPSSSRGNVVDHDAPHGRYLLLSFNTMQGSTSAVTEEYSPSKRQVAEGKSHMINVQPLKRSEMQARLPDTPNT